MSNMRAFVCMFFLAFAAQAAENTTGTTMTSATTQTSRATATSSQSTSSTKSTPSTESSTTSTTSAMEWVNSTTPEEATGLVEGTLSFVVTSGNASDLVDAFENDEDGSVAIALATSIAAGADGVSQGNVTITSVGLMGPSPAERRVQAAHLRSTRALSESVNQSLLVEFTVAFFGSDGPLNAEEVAAALTSDEGASAIESSLPTELQAIDPSLTIADIAVSADATTGTTDNNEVANFAAGPSTWHSCLVLACSLASLLLQ